MGETAGSSRDFEKGTITAGRLPVRALGPFARPAYVASGHWCTDGNGVWRVSRRHSEIEVDCRQQSQCLQLRSTVLRAFVHCAPI